METILEIGAFFIISTTGILLMKQFNKDKKLCELFDNYGDNFAILIGIIILIMIMILMNIFR